MDLSPEEQAVIQEGFDAEVLLAMPAFTNVLETLTFACASEILDGDPDDPKGTEKRERIYWRSRGLQSIQEELQARVGRKEAILFRLEQEAELEAPHDE